MNIRAVPDHVHAVLTRRAAAHGMSLRAYTVSVLAEHAAVPTIEEWLDEAEQLPAAASQRPAAEVLAAARAEDDEGLVRGAGRH